ncbi:MAG: UPF0175 family protein [Armatimonadetes bacterium]|nr:UPF0175 family protein [Armatimonadota bacterium]
MAVTIPFTLPEGVFSILRTNPAAFADEMRLIAAVKWYEMGRISQAKAAELAGLSRHDFVMSLPAFGTSPFQETASDLGHG